LPTKYLSRSAGQILGTKVETRSRLENVPVARSQSGRLRRRTSGSLRSKPWVRVRRSPSLPTIYFMRFKPHKIYEVRVGREEERFRFSGNWLRLFGAINSGGGRRSVLRNELSEL